VVTLKNPKFGTAFITGASSGIGAAFAEKLAARGTNLVLTARRRERLEELAGSLAERYGILADILQADLSEREGIEKAARCVESLDDLGLLVNNAGFGAKSSFVRLPFEDHEAMLDVHIRAVLRLTYAALPGMLERGKGSVINVSSISAFVPVGTGSTYTSSKAYLNSFSQSLQFELRRSGVKIQALCPGFTHTEFHVDPSFHNLKRAIPSFAWMSAEQVVEGSLKALERGKVIYIPGWFNRLAVLAAKTGLVRLAALLAASRLGR
jgi:uncharacterized protein